MPFRDPSDGAGDLNTIAVAYSAIGPSAPRMPHAQITPGMTGSDPVRWDVAAGRATRSETHDPPFKISMIPIGQMYQPPTHRV